MKKLLLKDYGTICSSQIYILDNNIQKNMAYFDYKTRDTINIVKKDSYYEAVVFEDKSRTLQLLYPSKNFYELKSLYNHIEIHNYINTKHRTKDESPDVGFYYTTTSPNGKVDFKFFIYKEQAVIAFKDNKYYFKIVNYRNEEIGEKIADVWVDNNGYKKIDSVFSVFSSKINNGEILCSLFLKKGRYDCIIMDHCPTLYKYNDSNNECQIYEIKYNEFGIPNEIINKDNPEEILAREETWFITKNSKYITSVYPLLFDAFNYNYIDKPMKYWCCATLIKHNNHIDIRRDIYEIDENLLEKLKEELVRDLDKCIIEHVEY